MFGKNKLHCPNQAAHSQPTQSAHYVTVTVMMMVIAPKSLGRQKEGAQEEEEEEAGGRREGCSIGTPTPGVNALTVPSWSGMSDPRNRRKHGRWCGVLLHRKGRLR